jgi:aryl sulfotransferase
LFVVTLLVANHLEVKAADDAARFEALKKIVNDKHPELFLELDNGFMEWAEGGNRMPPFLDFRANADGNYQKWLEAGDVVVGSGPKAGTMWLNNIVFLLRSGGWDDFDQLFNIVQNMDFVRFPGETFEDRVVRNEATKARLRDEFGITTSQYATHGNPSLPEGLREASLPDINPDVKYLCIMRNGKEAVRSIATMFNKFTPTVRDFWGDYPPPNMTPKQGFDFMAVTNPEFYFGHMLSFWQYKDLPNVHLVHFSDLKRDRRGEIKRIADFLEIDASDELIDTVTRKSSQKYMTSPENEEKYLVWIGQNKEDNLVAVGDHVRKGGGKNDRGKGYFSAEEEAQWEAQVQKQFGHDAELVEWSRNGYGRTPQKEL